MPAIVVEGLHKSYAARAVGPALVTLAVSAASFCALGLAVTAIIPTGDAAPAVANRRSCR